MGTISHFQAGQAIHMGEEEVLAGLDVRQCRGGGSISRRTKRTHLGDGGTCPRPLVVDKRRRLAHVHGAHTEAQVVQQGVTGARVHPAFGPGSAGGGEGLAGGGKGLAGGPVGGAALGVNRRDVRGPRGRPPTAGVAASTVAPFDGRVPTRRARLCLRLQLLAQHWWGRRRGGHPSVGRVDPHLAVVAVDRERVGVPGQGSRGPSWRAKGAPSGRCGR